jgi:hypothetical protein
MKKLLLVLLLAFSATTLAVAGMTEAPKTEPSKTMVKKHKATAKKKKAKSKAKEAAPSPAPAGQPSPQ